MEVITKLTFRRLQIYFLNNHIINTDVMTENRKFRSQR